MTSRDFCYWLQGKLELDQEDKPLNNTQVMLIRKHLALVFTHEIDPSFPAEQQNILNSIHDGKDDPMWKTSKPDGMIARC